jgi:hypothetical protein
MGIFNSLEIAMGMFDIDSFLWWDGIMPFLVPLIVSLLCAAGCYTKWRLTEVGSPLRTWLCIGVAVFLFSGFWWLCGGLGDLHAIARNEPGKRSILTVLFEILLIPVVVFVGLWLGAFFVVTRTKRDRTTKR